MKEIEKLSRRASIARRIHQAMNEGEKYLKPKVLEWLGHMTTRINRNLREKFLKDRAMIISAEVIDWKWIEDNGESILKPALLNIMARGANQAYKIAGIEARFDILNPRSVKWASEHCAKLVKEVSDETRKALKEIIRRGIKEGKSMPRIAREIRPIVGLTERQTLAVANREEWLIANRPELSRREIDRRMDIYARRMHRRRADMIARTESASAVDEGTLQGYEEVGIEKVEWLTAEADACDYCVSMNGKKFKIGESHGLQPVHPNCRCCFAPV